MELEVMHNLPLKQRGRPRGQNRPRLSKEQQKERNKYYEQLRRKEIKERWTELVQLINPEKKLQPKTDREVAIYIAGLEDDASDAEKEVEQLRVDNAELRKKLRRLKASLSRQESPPRKLGRAAPAGGSECVPEAIIEQVILLEEDTTTEVGPNDFHLESVEPAVQPSEINVLALPSSAEKMEENKPVAPNNIITDTKVRVQYDSGIDSPSRHGSTEIPENLLDVDLLDLIPLIEGEEEALLETWASNDIPDLMDIELEPSGFILPPPATVDLPEDLISEVEMDLAEWDPLLALSRSTT
ncbi:uncharacterized protein LOC114356686 [Ostrinia furnacalis]|uniref:uncharacterized protein LOC114356686 n=1 Tax=Ostrinia furnacalis TaxID=93504 RepID=UPI00103942B0|nr:uncharacterized protein LOC114356686 [Ostrinia furnacalis]